MTRKHRVRLPAVTLIALLLSAALFGVPIAAEEGAEAEREAAATITPEIEAPSKPNASPLAVITPVTEPDTPVVSGAETNPVTTERTAAVIEAPGNNEEPSGGGWFAGWFRDIINAITGIGSFFTGLGNTIGGFFTDLGDDLLGWFGDVVKSIGDLGLDIKGFLTTLGETIGGFFASMWDNLAGSIVATFLPLGGRQGMLDLLELGGSQYINGSLDPAIDAMYDVFSVFGVAIMLLCFCFTIAKGCFTTDLSAKNSILQPALGMIVALAAFALSEQIMTALFTISMNLTGKIANAGMNSSMDMYIDNFVSQGSVWDQLGYAVLNSILQLVLMLNVAKIALLQAIAPLFIGFAAGQGTRRFMLNLAKEYGKCCLMPPLTTAYAIITFTITDSTWGMISSIVIGFSILSIGSKMLDRLFA